MGFRLSPGLSCCRAGGELVFLDLPNDRYFALGARERARFERLLAGTGEDRDADLFVKAGLIRRVEGTAALSPVTARFAPGDIEGLERARPALRSILETGYHVTRARRAIAASRLYGALAALSRRKAGIPEADGAAVRAALRFLSARPLVPVPRRCLIDSVALLRLLLAKGLGAELIFGVRTQPFAAHCWLQTRHHILTCAQEEARNFTPILVL
ncbi:lasso peptide biosynthesis B2 protein [Sphingopyxis sp. MWB1]|uniref:lasso peptide biosynthesis B2 protein n=1 Tax=Sphingopyxis sp. MWB1 TaxID=1537715 RepID=UPI0006901BE2|nr:lasso peptide biosynthesis B2 protein [Sphingopyxis sp. MWB1]